MSWKTFSVKLDEVEDAAMIDLIESQANRSAYIKFALYTCAGMPLPEVPMTETTAAPLDMAALTQAIIDGISLGNANLATALEQAVRNGLKGLTLATTDDPAPEPPDRQKQMYDDILSGLDTWQ